MMEEALTIFSQCVLEYTCIAVIIHFVNIDAKLGFAKSLIFVVISSLSSTILDALQMPYHFVFSIGVSIVIFLILKKPLRISIINYCVDISISIIILTSIQILITGIAGLLAIDLIENPMGIIVIMIGLIVLFAWLSTIISIQVFIEKYYKRNRITIVLSIIALLFLITIVVELVLDNGNTISMGGNGQIIPLLFGFFSINLLLGSSLLRMKRITENNNAITLYGKHLQNTVNEYRKLIHDYKHHLQMVIVLNTKKNGKIINNELNEYIEGLIDRNKRTENISIIKDDVLISAMLYQKQELAKQKGIDFAINTIGSLSSYKIPNIELMDILANLLDNAFEEVVKLDSEKRIVHLEFSENYIEVRNYVSFEESNKEDAKNITPFFEQGYSTKGPNRGFGLSNVLSIAERYNISICTEWEGKFIVFRLEFQI